ncbi:unnamed protein product [Rotaria sordida]|uniref:Integrase catalytic domain-containing protein n=1 Tax=Rotaria sordida TaxID=392033 RepID=A0A815SSH0_9BILA|nr:unnamed protein product [Rotaria sordida]CAF1492648.1 unnamed protein product [Rotaria sordida]
MQKSESLGSLNLPTNSENLILTSTFNPASKPSSFSKMTRRMDIIPTPNRPDKLLPSTKTQSCSNEDSSVMNTVIATESNTAFEDDHVLCDNRQDTSVIPNLIHNQSHQKDHTSDEQEDDNLFDTFICENFVPFSGAEPINQWLDETDALFHRFKISRKLRFQAIPLLVQGDAKRKYIKNRHAIKSFDDFYEFLLTHFDSTPVTVSTSKPSQTNHKVEFAKESMCISNITTDSKLNVANITDATQLSQPSVSSYSKLAIDDTTTTSGDVSDSNLSGNTSTINRLPSDPVITDLRKAIVADFIRNPKIFRGNKDDVTKCTNSNYRSIPRTSFRAYQGSSNYTSDPNYVSKQNRTQASNSNYYYQSPRHSLSTNKYNDNTGSRKQKNIQPHKSFAQPDNKATSRSVNAVFTSTLPPNHDDNLDSLSTVVCHLSDGIASFNVLGSVDLSVEFNNFFTPIKAYIAQHLCTDMIIGMDYINKYNMNINVQKQMVTIQLHNHHIVVPIVNVTKSIRIPVISSTTVLLSSNSTRKIPVAIPISSISLPFIPASSFKTYVLVDNKNKHLNFQNYRSDLILYNTKRFPKVIRKGTCLGRTGMTPVSNDLTINSDSSNRSSKLSNNNKQFDDIFDIEYGLASKSRSILSSATSDNDTKNLTSDSTVSSTNPNVLAAMTLRPRKNRVYYTEQHISDGNNVNNHHDYIDTTDSRHKRKTKLTSTLSQNFFDITKLQVEQARDPKIQNIIKNLSTISSQSSFILENNKLYKLISSQNISNRIIKALYLPSSMINSLLKACHDDPLTGAHFSTDRMYYKIRPHFWWPNRAKRYGHLRSIPPPEGPFALIGIDFCGPLPRTPSENQYVLIITDYFTRHITALALPNCTAETAARALFDDCFCKFGIPSVILSDRGTHFQNKLMENLQHLIGYNHIYSTPYHPQTNGIVERFNATFVTQISKLQNAQHNNWDEYLQAVVFAYNTGVHKSTKFSPYELLYGRTARLPIHIQPTEFTFPKPNDYFEQLKKTLRIFHQASRENILFQQQANQAYYNKNRLDPQLKLGDKVLTRVHVSKGKLDPKFSPIPKIVVEIHHPMYVVEDECTHIRSQVHISDLRPISFE